MRLKIAFLGSVKVSGSPTVIEADLIKKEVSKQDAQRLFEMERAFNDLTKGRMHVSIEME